jgi:hypothetical protein
MKLIRRGEHTEGVSETCEFRGMCREPSAGELRAHSAEHKLPWGLCDVHLKPEHHPPDLRGRLHRW